MVEEFIDITPSSIGEAKKRNYVFQEQEWDTITLNPSGLTKEGIDKKIELWKRSSNKHVVAKYEAMHTYCKAIQKSCKTKTGKIIYAINPETKKPTWVEEDKPKEE